MWGVRDVGVMWWVQCSGAVPGGPGRPAGHTCHPSADALAACRAAAGGVPRLRRAARHSFKLEWRSLEGSRACGVFTKLQQTWVLLSPTNALLPACGLPILLPTGDLAFKMADQRYLWSVLPCLMAWPTIAMPTAAAAGIQVGGVGGGRAGVEGWLWCVHLAEASLSCLSHPGRA